MPELSEQQTQQASFSSLIGGDPDQRIDFVLEMMREISQQDDPLLMVQRYAARMRQIVPSDLSLSLSRRDLIFPNFRITRSSGWETIRDPWRFQNSMPRFAGGLIAELLYGERPVVIDELDFADDDPAIEYLAGHRSGVFIPLFDQGRALNGVLLMSRSPGAYTRAFLAEHLWLSNLFGRATHNLVLSRELRESNQALERELQVVADIQRSLLPTELPRIPTLDLAVHYQTSRHAGGDYYDFFPLPGGKWGFLIADVSGHGTPAAVIMAVTHSIAHTHGDDPEPPSKLLNFINRHLVARYTNGTGTFVTAFYGIYDPAKRSITYANAGHNPPRHKRCGKIVLGSLEASRSFPLGIDADERYTDAVQHFGPGDALIFYTDGITEARASDGELFGVERLDQVIINCENFGARDTLDCVLGAVEDFTGGAAPNDDRTVLVAKVV